ncbi:Trimethyllysine dioxygenase [Penicillium subrubescens]|uniref:Trimethyllysine dioxygenase n=1 Tax=Penicillium subrubescens TaxID=1316194 RepID=UPI0025450940|nr:Trimethyllysine dioxygenase [Penicillium subrubescens]KAJ5911379.1 Trimethyllysine dioxygenase [Penicillium subrubescens]
MSASRLVSLRAAALGNSYRPRITPLHVFKSGSTVIASRNVAPLARSANLPSNVSKRLLSDSTQPQATFQEINVTNDPFDEKSTQLAYRSALKSGNVVIKTNSKTGAPFWQFGSLYLRENCQCPKCIHPDTKQRIVDTFSLSPRVQPAEVQNKGANDIQVKWSDGHESTYSWKWLSAHRGNLKPAIKSKEVKPNRLPRPFKAYDPEKGNPYPEVAYEDVMSKDAAVLEWLEKIWVWGFCFVKGVPVNPESTKTLIERIAFIRHTHYGGFWDFTADLTYKDTAYTNELLGAHTDNTYFTDPARLQLFHLLSHTDGTGGESLLVDGFAAAKALSKDSPDFYNSLASSRHPWHASGNDDVCIQPSTTAPVLKVHPDTKAVYQVRWNNYDRAPKTSWHVSEQKDWYMAARAYNDILTKPSNEIRTQLQPGTALIFDNWRMLHGRSEFTGKRRMCGGYVNNDDFISRLRLLKFGRQTVLDNLGNTRGWQNRENPYSIY